MGKGKQILYKLKIEGIKLEKSIFMGISQLETERLILRKLTLEDDEAIFAYASDHEVSKFMTCDTHRSMEDTHLRTECGEIRALPKKQWMLKLSQTILLNPKSATNVKNNIHTLMGHKLGLSTYTDPDEEIYAAIRPKKEVNIFYYFSTPSTQSY